MRLALAIDSLDTWRTQLGLMPVPLFGHDNERRHVLLNGGKGNFCLDLATDEPVDGRERDRAWSADVGHYVKVGPDQIQVWRWDQSSAETYPPALVADNLVRFQTYLEESQPAKSASVVGHFMTIYRQLRSLLGDKVDGAGALQAFLYLLASADEQNTAGTVARIDWDKLPRAWELAQSLSETQREGIREDMLRGRPGEQLKPIIPLVLRHASGRLFQEAHYLVELDPQMSFFAASEAKPIARTSTLGAFFTPSPLVRTVVEEALKAQDSIPRDVTVLDPACGSGEFLRETLRQLQLRRHQGRVKLVGWDISSAALSMAQFALDWERAQSGMDVEVALEQRDALAQDDWDTGAYLILMNPPFISWQGMTKPQREALAERLGPLVTNRPDYASAFFYHATQSLPEGGVIGTVLPASLLDGESYVKWRELIAGQITPHLIARLGSHTVFSDAVVDPALYVGVKAKLNRPTLALWSNHKADSSSRALRRLRSISIQDVPGYVYDDADGDFSIYATDNLGRSGDRWAPRPYGAHQLLMSIDELPSAQSLFDISQGAITGLNGAFLVSKEYVKALPKNERKYFRPAVVNDSLINGVLRDTTYVFFPYGPDLAIQSEEVLFKKVKNFANDRLLPNKPALIKRASPKPDQWWQLTRPRLQLDAKGAKLISSYFGSNGSFAWDPDGSYVVVQGYGWTAKSDATDNFVLAYLAVLNHPLTDTLLSAVSNNLSGGQWNLSERYVNRLPLPDFKTADPALVEALTGFGGALARGVEIDKNAWTRAVYAAYGLAVARS